MTLQQKKPPCPVAKTNSYFAKAFHKEGDQYYQVVVKINVDKVSPKVLFKTMAKINDNVNETSFCAYYNKMSTADKSASASSRFLPA